MAACGTRSGYAAGCRCDKCRRANADNSARNRKRGVVPPGATHGLSTYTSYRCRCAVCCAAASERNHSQYERNKAGEVNHRGGYAQGCPCESCVLRRPERRKEYEARTQVPSLAAARRHRHEWTSAEMDLAANRNYTAFELSEMLGRTVYAVTVMRKRMDQNPSLRKTNMQGKL